MARDNGPGTVEERLDKAACTSAFLTTISQGRRRASGGREEKKKAVYEMETQSNNRKKMRLEYQEVTLFWELHQAAMGRGEVILAIDTSPVPSSLHSTKELLFARLREARSLQNPNTV